MAAIYLPPWRIDVEARDGVRVPLPQSVLARLAVRALEAAGAPRPASLGLVLSDDRELTTLNADHMGKTGPTDVLSFPLLPPSEFPGHAGQRPPGDGSKPRFVLPPRRRPHLGDIVISVERAAEQALDGRGGQSSNEGPSHADELRQLVVHGVLHVCGWDHADQAESVAMRALERDLLAAP